jgi:predicted SAM-dependent methyltransferase
LKILNIGCTGEYMCNDPRISFAGQSFEMQTMDVDKDSKPTFVHDIRQSLPVKHHFQFDTVYMSHVLEHIERSKLKQTIDNCWLALKSKGELWVFVPCLEWVCQEVLNGNESIVIQGSLYGGQKDEWDTHKVAFSLNALGALVTNSGFTVRKSGRSQYKSIVNGKEYLCYQNVVIGVK